MQIPVAIIMGSDSDWPLVKKTAIMLDTFEVAYDVRILSAHRAPELLRDYVKNVEMDLGVKVFIAAAGKAAHLPGVIASYTTLPVIGLPVRGSALDGMDALLSIVQMPAGVPVATVAIDGADNAALLAVQILAVGDSALSAKLKKHRADMTKAVEVKQDSLRESLGL